MRVLLINQAFYPDVVATAQHSHDLARYLVDAGHEVAVVTSRSIYGQQGAALPRYEVVDGIEIHRVGMSLFGKGSILLRSLDFGFFYLLATTKTFTIRRPDVVVPFTTPPFIALVGYMMKKIKRTGFVYWVMDLYPDLPVACGVMKRGSPVTRLCDAINRFCLRHADRAVVLGRCMKKRVMDKGIDERRLTHIGVWSDSQEVTPLPRDTNPYRVQWGLADAFVVMYSGNFGLGHDVITMCEAAYKLRERADIRFVFVGGGKRKKEVDNYMIRHGLDHAILRDYEPREKINALLSLGDLHLASLSEPVLGIMVPCKLFGIMAAERPAVFIGPNESELARILVENDCGFVVPCGDSDQLVAIIKKCAADVTTSRAMGARARAALSRTYNRQNACEAWQQVLSECARPKPVTPPTNYSDHRESMGE